MKRHTTIFAALLLATMLTACGTSRTTTTTTAQVQAQALPAAYGEATYEASSFTTVPIDLENLQESYADGKIIVTENELTIAITNISDTKWNFTFTGTTAKSVRLESRTDSMATLQGVSINASEKGSGPAFWYSSSSDLYLVLSGNNTINDNKVSYKAADGSLWDTTLTKAALYAQGNMLIGGDGSLDINAVPKHGVFCADVLTIKSGMVTVTLDSGKSDGTCIKATNGYIQEGGTVTLTGLNAEAGSENKGLKVDGEESAYGKGKGYIVINEGTFTSTTSGKGLSAGFDSAEDGDTASKENDPWADVYINGGVITIKTTATPREDSSPTADDGVSPEGIEGKRNVIICGGIVTVETTDDGINSSEGDLTINGGTIFAHSSLNDGIDSNGKIAINGGTVIALGAEVPEDGIDCDDDSAFTYNGGTIIALGGGNNAPSGSTTTGYCLTTGGGMAGHGARPALPLEGERPERPQGNMKGFAGAVGAFSSSDTFAVTDDGGNVLLAFTLPEGYTASNMLLASSSLKDGMNVTLTKDAQVEGELAFGVLYQGVVTIAGGTSSLVSINGHTTTITL